MQVREKVGKSRNTVFFQWFGAPEGWKVGSLKRRVRSQLARWEMKSCTPLWREAHLEVKMYKTHHSPVSSALNVPFLKDVSQNCFVFDVVIFKKWGSLAELLCFWCCQIRTLKKSRRIAPSSSLQVDRKKDNYNYNNHYHYHYTTLLC